MTQENLAQLQMIDQNLQNFLMQKQQLQSQQLEIDNALEEIEKTTGSTYKIIGAIMVASDKETLKEELTNKKEVIGLKLKTVEKQEKSLKEKAEKLQSDVLKDIKNKE